MQVLRIELEAPVCSFRYPHFLVGQQLSFEMPPPSTIFGHVCSAVGEWLERDAFRFAYKFTCRAKGRDLEKQQILSATGGKFVHEGLTLNATTEISSVPVDREFLFDANLVLYIDRPDLEDAFSCPRFPVVLGRSQDLACYTDVTTVELEKRQTAYFESTILPFSYRNRTARGITMLMPKYVAPPPFRQPSFDKYIVLQHQRLTVGDAESDLSDKIMNIEGDGLDFWVDPYSPRWKGAQRGLIFHSFT